MRRFRWLALVVWVGAFAGCQRVRVERPDDTPTPKAPPAIREEWAKKSPADWPQLVLTNDARFKNDQVLQGASAFLIADDEGRVLAVTARHLLGAAGGIDPGIPVERVGDLLGSWKLHPRTQPDKAVTLGAPELAFGDVVLLAVNKRDGELPAQPLRPRGEPAKVGEKVHLLGCPYSERDCRQNVYTGTVQEMRARVFSFRFTPPVNLAGFSGAPVIDSDGAVLGLLTGGGNGAANAEDVTGIFSTNTDSTEILVTPRAAEKILALAKELKATNKKFEAKDELRLRLRMNGDSVKLDLDPDTNSGDWRGTSNGVSVVVERKDRPRLNGAVVDFHADQEESFSVFNPRPYRRR
jgi:Fe-S cluster assembly iron-binding protein IscA